MFNSAVLDVAIGMIFVFLAVSLAASAVTEAIAGLFRLRSNILLQGIKDLLNDPNFNALAAQIYQHALVNPQNDGAGTTRAALTVNAPAYVQPMQFANALIDILDAGKPTISTPTGGHPGRMVGGNVASIAAAINYVGDGEPANQFDAAHSRYRRFLEPSGAGRLSGNAFWLADHRRRHGVRCAVLVRYAAAGGSLEGLRAQPEGEADGYRRRRLT